MSAVVVAVATAQGVSGPRSNVARVGEAVRVAGGPVGQKEVVAATGLNKGTVSKAVRRLVAEGTVVRREAGRVAPALPGSEKAPEEPGRTGGPGAGCDAPGGDG